MFLFPSMLCEAKRPFLFSVHYYLFSGNDSFSEKRKEKNEKRTEQKETTIF